MLKDCFDMLFFGISFHNSMRHVIKTCIPNNTNKQINEEEEENEERQEKSGTNILQRTNELFTNHKLTKNTAAASKTVATTQFDETFLLHRQNDEITSNCMNRRGIINVYTTSP